MKPGTYRLTADVPAIYPDRRKHHDWRAAPVKAGTLVIVSEWYALPGLICAYPSGAYSHHRVSAKEAPHFFAALSPEPIEETPSQWLAREHGGMQTARYILDRLVEAGLVTLEQIQQAADDLEEDES